MLGKYYNEEAVMNKGKQWLTITAMIVGFAAFWLLGLKLIMKLMKGKGLPCPASWSWIVDNPLRRWDVRHALTRAGLRNGETVLEVGPGPGAFTVDAARQVGTEGLLIAVDIQPEMIAQTESRVHKAGLTNVETHVANAYNLPVEDSTVDRAFLITVLPEIPDPVQALREIHRVIKPGGIVSITEEFLDPDYPRRITTITWAETAGFELADRYGNWWTYTLNFRKPA
jgi:SAM-dependent methyltransferase